MLSILLINKLYLNQYNDIYIYMCITYSYSALLYIDIHSLYKEHYIGLNIIYI